MSELSPLTCDVRMFPVTEPPYWTHRHTIFLTFPPACGLYLCRHCLDPPLGPATTRETRTELRHEKHLSRLPAGPDTYFPTKVRGRLPHTYPSLSANQEKQWPSLQRDPVAKLFRIRQDHPTQSWKACFCVIHRTSSRTS